MSDEKLKHSDPWSTVVIALTLILFLASIFVNGFTHELLLEAGVFLVSVKLILMAQRNSQAAKLTTERLQHITYLLERSTDQPIRSGL